MDPRRRPLFNVHSDQLFTRYLKRLSTQLGEFPFRLAETPLLLTPQVRDALGRSAEEIVRQLARPQTLDCLKKAIPPQYDVPGMDALPNCVQVDFALVEGKDGAIEGRVVELQAFPSLYALMSMMGDAWGESLSEAPELAEAWSCFYGVDRQVGLDLLRRTILGGEDPSDVVLVDHEPEHQKTSPDFRATQLMFGVDPVCVTRLVKRGRQLFREKDGQLVRVKRIYNRMVFDELEVKGVKPPFEWNEDLDISWCSHPNWYWTWSKYALPYLDHPAVPRARLLSDVEQLPEDLGRYVLKPLFSFAGAGVLLDVTAADVARVPAEQRDKWVLQEKIEYAPAVRMPDGNGVKAEVRVMLIRPPESDQLRPLIFLVRLSRGKMLGVDFNKGLTWVGGTVALWPAGPQAP